MFYDVLKRICDEKGTSPNAVAAKIGLSNSVATYWKKSGRPPKRETLEAIAENLNVPIDVLLERTESDICFEKLKQKAMDLQNKNAPDDHVRSEIIDMVFKLSDSQAEHLKALMEDMISE